MADKCPECGAARCPASYEYECDSYWQGNLLVESIDCLRRQLAQAQAVIDRLDWWMRDLSYKAPEQLHACRCAMIAELHPEARAAAEAAKENDSATRS